MTELKGAGPGAQHAWGRLVLSIGILGVGLFYAVETLAIRVLPTYSRVGPRFFPYMVAAGLILIGAVLAWRAWRGLDSDDDPSDDAPSAKLNMALVIGGLVLQSLVIDYIGFVLAATVTFVLTAAGFGDRHWLRNAAIGVVLAAASYLGFTRGLGLSLPSGLLEGLI